MKGISAEEQRDLILSIGTHNSIRPLAPVEAAELMDRVINAGTSLSELSQDLLLRDTSMIRRFLRLLSLNPDLRHLVGWGEKTKISFSIASEIARLKSPNEQDVFTRATLEHGLSKKEVIQAIEARNKLNKSVDESIEEMLQMRPQVIKQFLYIGSIISAELQMKLRAMTQHERDRLLHDVISAKFLTLPQWDGTLGVGRFSLIGNAKLEHFLDKLSVDFGEMVNELLESSFSK